MSIESRSQRHRPKPRRHLVLAAALVAFAVLAAAGVALWPGDGWRDQAIAGVFPAPPAGGWDSPTDSLSAPGAVPTVGATSGPATVIPARARQSVIPTRSAPAPAPPATSARATAPVPVTTTTAPSPTATNGRGRHKPKPSPGKPSPTTSQNDQGCLLGIIC